MEVEEKLKKLIFFIKYLFYLLVFFGFILELQNISKIFIRLATQIQSYRNKFNNASKISIFFIPYMIDFMFFTK